MAIHFSGQNIFSLVHIEGITLGAMVVDGIDEVGDQASEGQATAVYGAGFTPGLWEGKEPGVGIKQ